MTAPIAALVRRLTHDQQTATDGELLSRYATARDQTAFELLVWRHGGAVWATCRRMLAPDRDAAEDACQAAFLALATHAGRLRNSGAVGGWLRKVAVRACLDLQGKKRVRALSAEPASDTREPVHAALDGELRAALDDGLNRLPDKFRLPFVLCELDGLSNAEAAAVLGCAVGTVESRLTRARQRLRTFLTARGVQPAVLAGGVLALPESVRAALVNVSPDTVGAGVKELAARAVGVGLFTKLRVSVAVGVLLVASAVGFGLMPGEQPAPKPEPVAREQAPQPRPVVTAVPVEAKVPVPNGVLTRLGSPRLRHPAWVTAIAYSPDGKRIATVGYDNTVHIWDGETGAKVVDVRVKASEPSIGAALGGQLLTTTVCFAPDAKSVFVVADEGSSGELIQFDTTTGNDGYRRAMWAKKKATAKVWFSPDGTHVMQQVAENRSAHAADLIQTKRGGSTVAINSHYAGMPFEHVAFSADGQRYLFAGPNEISLVTFVDLKRQGMSFRLARGLSPTPQIATFDRVALSPDYSSVIAHEKTTDFVVAWDAKTNGELWRAPNSDASLALHYALGGKVIVVAGRNGAYTLDAATGKDTGIRFRSAIDCTCAAMHPNGKVVAFGTHSGAVLLYDVATGEPAFPTADPPHEVRHLRFSRDGQTVTGWAADWLKWDTRTGKQEAITNTGWNYGVPLSPDGQLTAQSERIFVSVLPKDHIRLAIRRTADGKPFNTFTGDQYDCAWVDFTPDSKGVIGAGRDGTLRIWDVVTGEERVAFKGHPQQPVAHAFSADGKVLVTATREAEDTPLRVWDVATGRQLAKFAPDAPVLKVTISADGSRIATAAYLNSAGKPNPREQVQVWDVKTGAVLATVAQGGDGGHVALSPCGRLVAVSARNKPDARVYEVASGGLRFHFQHKGEISSLAFAPDGRTLAAASLEAPVYLWNLTDGTATGEPPAWDGKQVWDDLASPDAERAFVAMRRIRANTTKAVAFLRDATRLPAMPSAERFRELVADLGSKDFRTREDATAALAEFGEAIRTELDAAITTATNQEAVRRLKLLRTKLDARNVSGVRLLRAVEAVEGLHPADGTPLLKAWASGLFGERLSAEAKAVLARRE